MGDADQPCALCGEPFGDKPWILLNRYALGTGTYSVMVSVDRTVDGDDRIDWDDENERAFGPALCFPHCLTMWLEAKMVGVDATQD